MARERGEKQIAANRKARHEYFVEETYECGLALHGTEVKSMRQGRVNLKEAFCQVKNGEMWVIGMHISDKKLLMHKSEIRKLASQVQRQGYTLIPLRIYLKDGRMKLELGLCKGKQLHDKRDDAADRAAKRDIERAMKNNG